MNGTLLGMPGVPPRAPAYRSAWDQALYGPSGFYRTQAPHRHFRTSTHASTLLADSLLELVRRHDLHTVVDVGAGRGELLSQLHRAAPDLELVAVEVASRPAGLPGEIRWLPGLPSSLQGLVVAHEWLDTVPAHVVQTDASGSPRLVHVDPATGRESPGMAVDADGVPPSVAAWLETWWPLDDAPAGARAEVGSSRDSAWSGLVDRLEHGLALAVDYGHVRAARPVLGSLRSYRAGRQVPVRLDGTCDVTADVAVDSVAAAVGGTLLRQSDALASLLEGSRPELELARRDPDAYLGELTRAAQAHELVAPGGFGDFWWVLTGVGVDASLG